MKRRWVNAYSCTALVVVVLLQAFAARVVVVKDGGIVYRDNETRRGAMQAITHSRNSTVALDAGAKPRVVLWYSYTAPKKTEAANFTDFLTSKYAGNLGNSVWQYAGSYCIFDRDAVEMVDIWPEDPTGLYRDRYDVQMIPVANMIWPIQSHNFAGSPNQDTDDHISAIRLMRATIEQTDRPAFMYGLGVQGYESIGKSAVAFPDLGDSFDDARSPMEYVLHGEYIRLLSALMRRSPAIGVRGEFSRRVLDTYGIKTQALGCPSLFINARQDLGAFVREKIDALPGNPKLVVMLPAQYGRKFFAFYFDQLRRHPDSVIVIQAAGDYDVLKLAEGDLNTTIPESRLRYFHDYESWSKFVCGFDVIVSGRIHGSMIGLNCPIPVMFIPTDLRTLELGQIMRIPMVLPNNTVFKKPPAEIHLNELYGAANFSGPRFDENRRNIARQYVAILEHIGMPPSKTIRALAALEK